ncbi:MAG: folate-binding protein [Pseudomonadota bacterium]
MSQPVGMVERNRAVLRMAGSDARAVLQDVVTNNVEAVGPETAVYAALLTPQGKYLSDFFLLDGGGGALLIDVAIAQAEDLARRLQMYSLRRDVTLSHAKELEIALVWSLDGDTADAPDAGADAMILPDPRVAALGWRRYGPGAENWLAENAVGPAETADRDALRIEHIVPESGVELVPNDTFILEAGFERLSGVDFRKGCYVGQEVTARMKHKTELRKGLVRVDLDSDLPPGTAIVNGGKPAGTLFSNREGQGLAHLRFDRAREGMEADGTRVTLFTETAG